jgi:ABC-type phosphate/phosphonate transport system substrate-binding protein
MSPRISLVLILALLIAGCSRASSAPAQKSPDGTMSLLTSVNQSKANPTRYLCLVVDITDSTGKSLHHEVTPASDTQRWSIQWVSNDEVLLKSSDVGNYRIRRQPDGTWKSQLGAK